MSATSSTMGTLEETKVSPLIVQLWAVFGSFHWGGNPDSDAGKIEREGGCEVDGRITHHPDGARFGQLQDEQ